MSHTAVKIPHWLFESQKDPSFQYLDEPHEYHLAGRRLWSPSSIFVQVRWVDKTYFTDEHRYRGHYVHWTTRLNDEGELDRADVAPEYEGFLDAHLEFSLKWKFKPRLIEKPIYHRTLGYGVTPDREGLVQGGEPAIVEEKSGEENSGPPAWWTAHQAACQDLAVGSWDAEPIHRRRIGVKLFRNGKFKAVEYDDQEDYIDFKAALRTVLRSPGQPPLKTQEIPSYMTAL